MQSQREKQVAVLLAPVVEGMGYEFVGCEQVGQGRHVVLRVYIDKQAGVNLDDCAKVSDQVGALLDVEGAMSDHYNLEVSSPGLDRPLFSLAQLTQAVGQMVSMRLQAPLDGRSRFKGLLKTIIDENIVLGLDDQAEVTIPFTMIARAKIVYQYEQNPEGKKRGS